MKVVEYEKGYNFGPYFNLAYIETLGLSTDLKIIVHFRLKCCATFDYSYLENFWEFW